MSRLEAAAKAIDAKSPFSYGGTTWPEWQEEARAALAAADAHDRANGIHRIVIDDATEERAARALFSMVNRLASLDYLMSGKTRDSYVRLARAVLAAAVKEEQA
ncbi:hypothetical protein [Arthrobacter bambusae]|uniref:Uncharacterized protein n=1 Tax=Arthrobacter bambusae TaxID=1338426 RepID=A0AAW8DA09_9MICC|nr:hypothetical protein [Arthrobacter bambusae]MDP9903135.1 hypothetical protein [Arthrobacter bambusae]MDQ0128871.1 hypothetical protein [Arthrobacter bambusae]MDQ0180212.1 hypothetical protein [Arthrobacter bambusae]